MRLPLFFPQALAALGAMFKAPAAHSQIARIEAEIKAGEVPEGTCNRGRWHVRAPWRKFFKRRIARIAKHSRNLNRRISAGALRKQAKLARSLSPG
jgi:hypothetical protein